MTELADVQDLYGDMLELEDSADLGSVAPLSVRVRIPLSPPNWIR